MNTFLWPVSPRRTSQSARAATVLVAVALACSIGCTVTSRGDAVDALSGSADGTALDARFDNPVGVFIEPGGTLLVTEYDGARLRRVRRAGTTSTVATGLLDVFGLLRTSSAIYVQTDCDAQGRKGPTSGTIWKLGLDGSDPQVVVTALGRPRGLVELSDGRIVVSDRAQCVVTLLDPMTGKTSLLAGSGVPELVGGVTRDLATGTEYNLIVSELNWVKTELAANGCPWVVAASTLTSMADPSLKDVLDAIAKLDAKVDKLDTKVDRVDAKVESKINGLRSDMMKRFDDLDTD
jgi:hypothetical protein